ncbi:MAG: helix-turn-helix transcriptional regulator [Rhodothermales bacterium]
MELRSHSFQDLVQQKIEAYRIVLTEPDSTWTVDVRVFLKCLNERLYEASVTLGEIRRQFGLRDNNISTDFAAYVGMPPREYRIRHRVGLARQLLRDEQLRDMPIAWIALAVGYTHSAFSTVFKQRVGYSPLVYRAG